MDKHGFNDMNKVLSRKEAVGTLIFIGTSWFILSPLWVGLIFVIPGFSFLIYNSDKLKFRSVGIHHSSKIYRSKSGYQHSSTLYGVNCTSLIDRKNKYGY